MSRSPVRRICPRCDELFWVPAETPDTERTHCTDCAEWIAAHVKVRLSPAAKVEEEKGPDRFSLIELD